MNPTRRARRVPMQHYVPVGYFAVALGLAAMLLPTALRPPQDLQNASTAFSPDAPPDETPPEALLASLRQASSSTAGGGIDEDGENVLLPDEEPTQAVAPPPERPGRPPRGRCFGEDPPRQTESLYSQVCVPAFTEEDNGGKTTRGVEPDEIKIAIAVGLSYPGAEGALEKEFSAEDPDEVRLLKVWQAYFNDRFEFYKRYLRFYIVKMSADEEDQARAAVETAQVSYGAFAIIGNGGTLPSAAAAAEAVRRKMVVFIPGQNPVDFYRDSSPYAYSFTMDSWQTRYIGAEIACKQFAPPSPPGLLNNKQDLTFKYDQPRVWGLITYQDEVRAGATKMYKDRFKRCGIEFKVTHEYNLTDNQQSIAGSMAKMKENGVTTIVSGVDPITPAVLTNEAERLVYYPEYLGTTGWDPNATGRLMQDNQAEHVLAVASGELPREDQDKDWYRAYKEVDPEGPPEPDYFRFLQQLSGGIQGAGPRLTPETFWEGLRKTPCREPQPIWSVGGCYREADPKSEIHYLGDYTYQDYVSLAWFDNKGDDPDSSTDGAYCYMWFGKHWKFGDLPTERLPWRDPKQCFYSPPRGEQG